MRRLTISVVAIAVVASLLSLCGVGDVAADTVLIDFEQFADGVNLQGVNLGGVTLTNPSGKVEIFDNRFGVSYHSATKAVASPNGVLSVNPLIGVFDKPVSYVSLWGGDSGQCPELDSWELLAFDAPDGGNLLGRVSSGSWYGSPYRQLTISAEAIWRFEANWTGPVCGIGYDDLEFTHAGPDNPPTPVPEPGAAVPGALGLLSLLAAGWRKRAIR